jgi:hypothetical protein
MATKTMGRNRRLQLHFDLNNTIVMMDGSKGLDIVSNLQRIVAKSAWGVMTPTESAEEPYTW